MEDIFGAFIRGVDFSLGSTSSRDGLSFGLPVEGTVEPLNKAGHGARFEKVEGERGRVPGLGLILRSPVGVRKASECGGWDGKVNKGGQGVMVGSMKGDTVVHSPLEVSKDVLAVIEMAGGGTVEIFGQDVCNGGKIRTGRGGEPLEGAN